MAESIKLGKELREKEYTLTNGVFVNHGSYGAVPIRVFNKQMKLREEMESHPDSWYRRTNPKYHRKSMVVLCKLLNTDYKNTVFVENVSFGTASVLHSLKWTADDAILLTNLSYCGTRINSTDLKERYGTTELFVDIKFPIESEEQIIESYRQILEKHRHIKLAVIDHITSTTAIIMPIKKLVELCHEYGVLTLIDGAHTLGQIHLDIPSYNSDFYTGNMHKWMMTPRGSGYLWIDSKHLNTIKPAVVSHFNGYKLHYDFCVRGTRDDTAYYTINTAVEFFNEIGGLDTISKYCCELLDNVIGRLEKSWNTNRFSLPSSMTSSFIRVIRLPDLTNYEKSKAGAKSLEDDMFLRFNIQCFCAHLQDGENYMRISCYAYNCLEDYVELEATILKLTTEPNLERETEKTANGFIITHWTLDALD